MNILNKIKQWLNGDNFERDQYLLKKEKDGRLVRGTVRSDGKIVWNSWRLRDGTWKYNWYTPEEYARAVLKNRRNVRMHYQVNKRLRTEAKEEKP
jgi:hypothetical protein